MLGELTPCGGGPPIPLLKQKLLVGRRDSCDLPLRHSTVSSRHCELELIDGYWTVRDLGSQNGIQVNGVACQSQRLLSNDILSIAKQRYRIVYAPPGEEPPLDRNSDPYGFGGSLLEKAGIVLNSQEGSASRRTTASGAAPAALGELVPCGGGSPIPLLKTKLLVGRHPGCDVPLPFPTVSSRHCELEFRDGYWFVRDLGSSNGVRVDGERCESQRLMPHNVLSISSHRYRLSYRPRERDPSARDAAARPFGRSLLEKAGLLRRKTEPPARPTPSPSDRDQLPAWLAQEDEDDQRPRYRLDEDL